ncbi:hypothetical protein [Paenibacillus glycinis]|uniref:Lipoprotein SmpA/OmlA domain-containing protein n=1 Tax=Paenibacillus glycinis TaxID=2697035 RepID=A0ABW9XNA3_9BACL|nr:hypothetical protein [Paenibacillus glycinis]NBD24106.1 hypothetical protein [Paenibacillus glycinis]
MRLRKTMLALACAVVFACLLAGCGKSETPLTYADKVDSTDLSAEHGQVALGIGEEELVKQLGKPIRTLNDGGRSFLFMYEEYQYTSVDNTVVGYSLGPKSATAKGLKLGAVKADVVKGYGEGYYERGGEGPSATIGYIDKTKRLALEFELKDGIVKAISLTSLSMYE